MKRPSQKQRILDRLMRGDRLTQEDCDQMYPKIKRLAARIYDLEGDGHNIASRIIPTPGGASVAEYRMIFPAGGQGAMFGNPDRGRPE